MGSEHHSQWGLQHREVGKWPKRMVLQVDQAVHEGVKRDLGCPCALCLLCNVTQVAPRDLASAGQLCQLGQLGIPQVACKLLQDLLPAVATAKSPTSNRIIPRPISARQVLASIDTAFQGMIATI